MASTTNPIISFESTELLQTDLLTKLQEGMEATSEGRDGGADMLFALTTSLAPYSLKSPKDFVHIYEEMHNAYRRPQLGKIRKLGKPMVN